MTELSEHILVNTLHTLATSLPWNLSDTGQAASLLDRVGFVTGQEMTAAQASLLLATHVQLTDDDEEAGVVYDTDPCDPNSKGLRYFSERIALGLLELAVTDCGATVWEPSIYERPYIVVPMVAPPDLERSLNKLDTITSHELWDRIQHTWWDTLPDAMSKCVVDSSIYARPLGIQRHWVVIAHAPDPGTDLGEPVRPNELLSDPQLLTDTLTLAAHVAQHLHHATDILGELQAAA